MLKAKMCLQKVTEIEIKNESVKDDKIQIKKNKLPSSCKLRKRQCTATKKKRKCAIESNSLENSQNDTTCLSFDDKTQCEKTFIDAHNDHEQNDKLAFCKTAKCGENVFESTGIVDDKNRTKEIVNVQPDTLNMVQMLNHTSVQKVVPSPVSFNQIETKNPYCYRELINRVGLIGETRRIAEEYSKKESLQKTTYDYSSEINGEMEVTLPLNMEYCVFNVQTCSRIKQEESLPINLREITQVARLLIHLGRQTIMASPLGSKSVIVAYEKCEISKNNFENAKSKMIDYFGVQLEQNKQYCASKEERLLQIKNLIEFSIHCRLLETGKWIHVGDNMRILVHSRVTEPLPSTRTSINAPVISFCFESISVIKCTTQKFEKFLLSFKLYPSCHKIFPVLKEEIGRIIYCLPRCATKATLASNFEESDGSSKSFSLDQYRKYWYFQHGYKLADSAFRKFVKVSFSKKLTLNYPLGVLWREKFVNLTSLSRHTRQLIGSNALESIEKLVGVLNSSIKIIKHDIHKVVLNTNFNQFIMKSPSLNSAQQVFNTLQPASRVVVPAPQNLSDSKPFSTEELQQKVMKNSEIKDLFEELRNNIQHGCADRILPPLSCRKSKVKDTPILKTLDGINKNDIPSLISHVIPKNKTPKETIHRILPPPATYAETRCLLKKLQHVFGNNNSKCDTRNLNDISKENFICPSSNKKISESQKDSKCTHDCISSNTIETKDNHNGNTNEEKDNVRQNILRGKERFKLQGPESAENAPKRTKRYK